MDEVRLTAWVAGRVQGVGFRWWVRRRAEALGLSGTATNLPDGRVEVVAEGSRSGCGALLQALRTGDTPGAPTSIHEQWGEAARTFTDFTER